MTGDRGRRRWPAATALVLYAAFLAFVTLAPSAGIQTTVVARTSEALALVLPTSVVIGARVEMGLNALMVVPLTYLSARVFPRVRWQDWTAYGFLGACLVELVQGLALPGRSATFVDVVANTLGALVGAVLGAVLRGREQVGASPVEDTGRHGAGGSPGTVAHS